MEQGYQLLQKQKQVLSQKQLQSLHILTIDNIELDMFLQSEYLENPMLEHTENTQVSNGNIEASDEEIKWNQKTEEKDDLKTFLREQLSTTNSSEQQVKEYMIECIDDTGYFTIPIDEVAKECEVSTEYIYYCLKELQLLEPVGVFSANIQECLLRQLEVLNINNSDLECIIKEHLEDVANGNISHISRSLELTTLQVRKYILIIESLSPRPAVGFGEGKTKYVVPDIIFHKETGEWNIELNDHWIGDYQINDYYLRIMDETKDPELKKYFREKANRVQLIFQNIEQRRQTLLNMSRVLLEFQKAYFEEGADLKPMTMSTLAQEMGVHPSTVSRAVKGKYLQFPRKTILVKDLFSSGIQGASEEEVNAIKIKELLKKWIKEENSKKPYSDQKLVEMLENERISISRRAVAKYRISLGIKGSFDRKER